MGLEGMWTLPNAGGSTPDSDLTSESGTFLELSNSSNRSPTIHPVAWLFVSGFQDRNGSVKHTNSPSIPRPTSLRRVDGLPTFSST